MSTMNQLLKAAANRGRLDHREAAVPEADRLKEDALRADAEKPIPSMNARLRAAAGVVTPERRAELQREITDSRPSYTPPEPDIELLTREQAERRWRAVQRERGRSGVTGHEAANAMIREAFAAKRYGRPMDDVVHVPEGDE